MIRTVEPEAIADRIRDAIWTLQPELGLKMAQVGDLTPNPEPDQVQLLEARCPCALVIFQGASDGRRLQGQDAYGSTLRFMVHLLRFVPSGQNYDRVMLQNLKAIVGLFVQGKFRLPGARIPGTVIRSCVPEEYTIDNAIALKDVSFGHGTVQLAVDADSHDFTPE